MQIFHDKVEMLLVLKTVVHLDNEGVFANRSENETFQPDVIDLSFINHILLLKFFHCIEASVAAMADEENLSKTSLAYLANDVIVCHAHGVPLFPDVFEFAHELFFAQTQTSGFINVTKVSCRVDAGHFAGSVMIKTEEIAVVNLNLSLC